MKLKKSIAISEGGFVFNAERGDSFSTNPIGIEILQLLKDGESKTAIHNFIQSKYQVDEATCEKDVYDFIKMLNQHNFIQA